MFFSLLRLGPHVTLFWTKVPYGLAPYIAASLNPIKVYVKYGWKDIVLVSLFVCTIMFLKKMYCVFFKNKTAMSHFVKFLEKEQGVVLWLPKAQYSQPTSFSAFKPKFLRGPLPWPSSPNSYAAEEDLT
jgi:hypothetical protein